MMAECVQREALAHRWYVPKPAPAEPGTIAAWEPGPCDHLRQWYQHDEQLECWIAAERARIAAQQREEERLALLRPALPPVEPSA